MKNSFTRGRKKVEILNPECNLETVRDGRGGIFTWIPDEPLVEFNMLYFQPGKTRGFHYHPHFIEYSLVTDGSGVLVTRDDPEKKETESLIHLSKGVCIRAEINIYHTIYAITEMTVISMLTKRWDHSNPPIVKVDS